METQVVEMHHEEPDLLFTLAHGLENDPYDGLDRFDRVVDMRRVALALPVRSSGER